MIQARSLSLILGASLILGGAALLLAADPDWKTKTVADWSEADAQQILANSPWAKVLVAGIARRQTEDQRREGGNMGQPTGVGYDGVEDRKRPLPEALGNPFIAGKTLPSTAPTVRLLVRWESAMPIRVAELKAHEEPPPTLSDEGYSIAVYGVPASYAKGDPTSLGRPLKESAALKREGKPDVLPARVEVFQLENSVVVTYLFPLSAEIGKKDTVVEFSALIGRLQVSQHFLVQEMQFQGKLEL
jgi:hypothetical protein